MIALGIVLIALGTVVLIGTQWIIRKRINEYKKNREDTDEMR